MPFQAAAQGIRVKVTENDFYSAEDYDDDWEMADIQVVALVVTPATPK